MNKNILIRLLLIVTVVASCNDKFMDRYPLDQITDQSYWKTEQDLQLYNNAVYPLYITGYTTGFADGTLQPWGVNAAKVVYGDVITDNAAPNTYSRVSNNEFIGYTSGGSGSNGWNFDNIRKLNFFLENYKRTNLPEDVQHVYAGEIYFFKAWDYFEKVKLFGDVPWLDKTLNETAPELFGARTPRAQVMDSVMRLLDSAISWLPVKGTQKAGRINKDVALHLKTRIGLHEGTFRKYHGIAGGEKFLRAAVSAAEKLMAGGYAIYKIPNVADPYNQLFAQYSYAGNPEIILWKEYSETLQLGAAFSRYFAQNLRHQFGVTRNLVDEYLCTDGKPVSNSTVFNAADRGFMTKEFTNRDPRLAQTVAQYGKYENQTGVQGTSNAPYPNIPGLSGNKCPTGYRLAKWFLNDPKDWDRVTNGMQAAIMFRYAETLLNYAEAKFELGECDQTVIDQTINTLRDRVGMPHLDVSMIPADAELDQAYSTYCGYVPQPLLREIRRERRVELAFEGFRWDDLMRWKAGRFLEIPVLGMKFVQTEFPKLVPGKDIYLNAAGYIEPYQKTLPTPNRKFDARQYYFPIPIEDLVLNKSLTQNPGWLSQ
ncbi:RagB/SusD family nutrient uptake outer membrane protein [Niabella pedocola]|uniref:RagB/SusD family nutrient uptake outer membrane protein n=1 Tax=Niabella pedocola TaxID=1752077 RepID=A0ABS8PVW8_9BACT|nr:RagB/SusD family nutrient uptake outer membrane protein [Niabella pedocola]MCD2425214.1 RagB/SusD family nutrient uptake outer membrane protein [Niabella pedocola]